MGRPYHGRRRRRPGRGRRHRGGGLSSRPHSYQDYGLKFLYDLILPGIRGPDRRRLFNDISCVVALGSGVLGAILGCAALGPFGVFLGFGAGFALGANFLARNRYYRP